MLSETRALTELPLRGVIARLLVVLALSICVCGQHWAAGLALCDGPSGTGSLLAKQGPKNHAKVQHCIGGHNDSFEAAVSAGCLACVEKWIKAGADVNATFKSGLTPLVLALREGKGVVAGFLLAHGADVRTPDPRYGLTPLHLAVGNGDFLTVPELLRAGAPVDARDKLGETPLHRAAVLGDTYIVQMLLDAGARPDVRNRRNMTAVHVAAASQEPSLASCLLLLEGSGVGAQELARVRTDDKGMTLLHWAARKGDEQFARAWVRRAAPVDLPDVTGATPLALASEAGHARMIEFLAANGASVNSADRSGLTPLARAARVNPNGDAVQVLLKAGAQVDLLAAACLGRADKVRGILQKYPAAVAARDQYGYTALDLAVARKHGDVVAALLENGSLLTVRQGNRSSTPISTVPLTEMEAVAATVRYPHLAGVRDADGRTPLHYAAISGELGDVRRLIEAGARVDWQDTEGNSPLHDAAARGHVALVRYLVSQGATVSLRNNRGLTPEALAAENGQEGAAEVLRGITTWDQSPSHP